MVWSRLKPGQRYLCVYCELWFTKQGNNIGWDHFIPKSLGGLSLKDNLLIACSKCNQIKSNLSFSSIEKVREFITTWRQGKINMRLLQPGYKIKKIYHKKKRASSFYRWDNGWETIIVKDNSFHAASSREQAIIDKMEIDT